MVRNAVFAEKTQISIFAADSVEDAIYTALPNASPCVRLLYNNGQIGCASRLD